MYRSEYFQNAEAGLNWLESWLRQNKEYLSGFRLRAVLVRTDAEYRLRACTIEAFSKHASTSIPRPDKTREYLNAILIEEWLELDQVMAFFKAAIERNLSLGGRTIRKPGQGSVQLQQLSFDNPYMTAAGYVFSCKFEDNRHNANGSLVSFEHPYYPDSEEATKDWMPFKKGGDYQGMVGDILCLLPESRAFVAQMDYRDETLSFHIDGAKCRDTNLVINGAYWQDSKIHHFRESVAGGTVTMHLPQDAERLDYRLIDENGNVYDGSYMLRNELFVDKEAEQIQHAVEQGEGITIEFKPFIRLKDKPKLSEVLRTVVAFANTSGGSIYLGINDECQIVGISKDLEQWKQSEVPNSTDALADYIGKLKKGIRDAVIGQFELEISAVMANGTRVIVINVGRKDASSVCYIREGSQIFVRRGSNTVQANPDYDLPRLFQGRSNIFF